MVVLEPDVAAAFTKRRLYREAGIAVYWVIAADAGTAEIWTPLDRFPRMESERLVWMAPGARHGRYAGHRRDLRRRRQYRHPARFP